MPWQTISRERIAETVIGGLMLAAILAGVSWFAGWLPAVWAWIVGMPKMVSTAMLVDVSIPVWLLSLGTVGLAVCFRGAVRMGRKPVTDERLQASALQPELVTPQLNRLEEYVMRQLVRADGADVPFENLARLLDTPKLILEQSLEKLIGLQLIERREHYVNGTELRLTRTGRDFAIREGYVSDTPHAS